MTAHAGSAALLPVISSIDRDSVRREMRARRRALSANDRQAAGARFAAIAQRAGLLKCGHHVGLYLPHGSEADPSALLYRARKMHCAVFLPVIRDYRSNRMRFAPFGVVDRLVRNRFGIREPIERLAESVEIRRLDVIFVPVVAVDQHGNRIGSGAGFYDRALKHLRSTRQWRRPKLVGLAFECQRIAEIPRQPWDVPLDFLLTEKKLYRFRSPTQRQKGEV